MYANWPQVFVRNELDFACCINYLKITICCVGNVLQGLFILGLCFSGCNSMAAVIMLISATAVNGAVSSGVLPAVVDLAPNFAGKKYFQNSSYHAVCLKK